MVVFTFQSSRMLSAMKATWHEDLKRFGQEHLLRFWSELTPAQQTTLADQLGQIDFSLIDRLYRGEEKVIDWRALSMKAEPPAAIRLGDQPAGFTTAEAKAAGEEAIRKGEVAMILVAGGQGTRLGFDQPKGLFRIGPLSSRTLFEVLIDRLRALMKRMNASIPLYVMTSPATDAATRLFFSEQDRFGLGEDQLRIFCQGTMPAVDDGSGRILMSSPNQLALSPNGHGGLVAALAKHGCLEDAADRGITQFFYCQIDNPMVPVCDPTLIGIQVLGRTQILTQVVKKRFATEKVGNVVSLDGRTQIIEYSDLAEEAAQQKNADGTLKLWAGNIAVHIFQRRFLEQAMKNSSAMPFHRAHKKVPYIDERGGMVEPKEPNAFKFELFIFDLLPLAERSIVVESDAADVFAPVKNADGAPTDTPAATKEAILNQHRRWLDAAGVRVAKEARVEIHPGWALDADEVAARAGELPAIESDLYLKP